MKLFMFSTIIRKVHPRIAYLSCNNYYLLDKKTQNKNDTAINMHQITSLNGNIFSRHNINSIMYTVSIYNK